MAIDDAERRRLLPEVGEQQAERHVLVHVGDTARMIAVLITEHRVPSAAATAHQ
ncbi:hypothetical protein D3C83_226590 [compost metagenome]